MTIINAAIEAVKPDVAVKRALSELNLGPGGSRQGGMETAKAALQVLDCVVDGVVVTKYDHVMHPLPRVLCYEGESSRSR